MTTLKSATNAQILATNTQMKETCSFSLFHWELAECCRAKLYIKQSALAAECLIKQHALFPGRPPGPSGDPAVLIPAAWHSLFRWKTPEHIIWWMMEWWAPWHAKDKFLPKWKCLKDACSHFQLQIWALHCPDTFTLHSYRTGSRKKRKAFCDGFFFSPSLQSFSN